MAAIREAGRAAATRAGTIPGSGAARRTRPPPAGCRPRRATQPVGPQPTFTPRTGETRPAARKWAGDGPGRRRGRGAGRRAASGGRAAEPDLGRARCAADSGSASSSAVRCIGAVATIVTKAQPGSVLGLFVLAGTVAAALTVQPRTGRLIFPVPALSYLIAALTAGAVYDRSADKTELAVGAAQWIANGFFVMVLSTLLAIALTTVRWYMWRR